MANLRRLIDLDKIDPNVRSAKECLHIGSDGTTLHLHNPTEEEREFVERYRDVLENVIGIKITIEEVINDG